jgi:LacI family transcriptional regulator
MNPGPETKLTLYEVAKLAGVSKSTVSRVLMDQADVSAKTKARILKIMEESGYRPSRMARSLAGGRSNLIAVVTSGMFSGYYAEVLRGIDVVAHDRGVRIVTSIVHDEGEYSTLLREYAHPGQVDGVILVAPPLALFKTPAPEGGVPLVMVSASATGSRKGWGRFDSVTVDNSGAMERAVDHLVAGGRVRLLHLAGSKTGYDARERCAAFDEVVRKHPKVRGRILPTGPTSGEAAEQLLEFWSAEANRADGIIAYNDDIAIASVKALRSRGIRVPEDVAVVGCDDEHAAEIMGLTTLHMPMVGLGEEAARLLFGRADGEALQVLARQSVLDMPLLIRATTPAA